MFIVNQEIKGEFKYTTYSNGAVIKEIASVTNYNEIEVAPSESDITLAQILLEQQGIQITQQSQDAVLAEILLAQQTV